MDRPDENNTEPAKSEANLAVCVPGPNCEQTEPKCEFESGMLGCDVMGSDLKMAAESECWIIDRAKVG